MSSDVQHKKLHTGTDLPEKKQNNCHHSVCGRIEKDTEQKH
jgi:hypothetical protein